MAKEVLSQMDNRESALRFRLRNFLFADNESREKLRSVLHPMREEGWQVFLFGGLLRDVLRGVVPRDVDLVVEDRHLESITHHLAPYISHQNRFGGLKIRQDGWDFDVWPVSQTWAFQHSNLWPDKSFLDLPSTTFLNIEAIAVELWPLRNERVIYENGFYSAFENKTIEVNYQENPYPDFCIARAIFTAAKLRFDIGVNLTKYIANHVDYITAKEIALIQRKHYKYNLLPESYLNRLLDSIRWSADWQVATRLDRINNHHSFSRKYANPFQLKIWPDGF